MQDNETNTYCETIAKLEEGSQSYIDPRWLNEKLKNGTITAEQHREIYDTYIIKNFTKIMEDIQNSQTVKELEAIASTVRRIQDPRYQMLSKEQAKALEISIESQLIKIQSKLSA